MVLGFLFGCKHGAPEYTRYSARPIRSGWPEGRRAHRQGVHDTYVCMYIEKSPCPTSL